MSIEVKARSHEEIDAWPVEEAGIPVRILTGCERLGYKTVGKIRHLRDERLLAMHGVGVTTVKEWRDYLDLALKLERGHLAFDHVLDILKAFLSPIELNVVSLRYGLTDASAPLARKMNTLQQIGNREKVTRERIRQIEAAAMEHISCRLAQACLDSVYQLFDAFLRKQSLVLEARDFVVWQKEEIWGGLSPAHLMALLGDLRKNAWYSHRGYITRLTRPQIEGVERTLVQLLRLLNRPVSSSQIGEHAGEALAPYTAGNSARLIEVVLRHAPDVERSSDGLFFAI